MQPYSTPRSYVNAGQAARKLKTGYSPPLLLEWSGNGDDIAIGTYYVDLSAALDYDNFVLDINISAGVEVLAYTTILPELPNDDPTDWHDNSPLVFGEGISSITGAYNKSHFQVSKVRSRYLLEVIITNATNSVNIWAALY